MHLLGTNTSGYVLVFCIQVIFLIIFGIYGKYDSSLLPTDHSAHNETETHKKHVPSYARKYSIYTI